MASKHKFRPPPGRAALVTFIAAICILALLVAPVSAQSGRCQCTRGRVHYNRVRCYYYYLGWGDYAVLTYNRWYHISCQTTGGSVGGNHWWNKVRHRGRYCYVNDYYLRTGCATRCWNLDTCH